MEGLLAISRLIDRTTMAIGRAAAWLVVAAAAISASNAIVRKAFDYSSNALLEIQWWLFAAVFLLAAPWALAVNEHIRIDIVNSRLSKRTRNIIELVGHSLFLLPAAALIAYTSWTFFASAYVHNETSPNAGGLLQWPIKALIPFAFALLFVQGISEIIKRVAVMRGVIEEPRAQGGYHDTVVSTGAELKDDQDTKPADGKS